MENITLDQLETLLPKAGTKNLIHPPKGFRWHDTPSHGFLMTDPHITNKIPHYMRSTNFSKIGKYEEDCDWCLPVIANIGVFERSVQITAIETFYNWFPNWFMKYYKKIPVDSFKYKQANKEIRKTA